MGMKWYDIFHLESCFICHPIPALAAFPSSSPILLTVIFSNLPSTQFPFYSSFSPVIAADRSLLVLLQFPLKPSMPTRTIASSALHLK